MKTKQKNNTTTETPTETTAPEPYIDVDQAAAFLALPQNTVYKLALSRRLPSYKLGKLRRFRLSELAAVMESARVVGDDQAGQ